MDKRRVAVTGLGAITPIGLTVRAFWDSALAGESGIREITQIPRIGEFSTRIGGEVKDFNADQYLPSKEQRKMDPFTLFGFAAAAMALEDSGLDMSAEDPFRAGVIIGSGIGGLQIFEKMAAVYREKGPSRFYPLMIPQMIPNILSSHVAIRFGLRGPNFCIVTACASASHSLGESMRIIQSGDAEIMISGGAEGVITPLGLGGFCALRALSTRNGEPTRASRPFDMERDGFVMGEGAGILVLEEMEHARRRGARIYAELAGYGRNCDAYHLTAPDETGEAAARCMALSIKDAGITAEDISYINAHGTSTKLNDRIETLAIKRVFGPDKSRSLMISSTKSMTGHLLGAAGGVEAVVSVKTLETGCIHPTINYEYPDPDCDLDYVPNEAREKKVSAVLSNSFGFGGHNAVLCFRAYRGI
ncbi:MAG: beta-ketoacyl-[acyl-carrier-protein] synthase II [Spirochaetales bacterium]|nr:MAG: beta-ketoacyl-[acyl-carrier-protein] synthase II [Spirochaetales bacterium]